MRLTGRGPDIAEGVASAAVHCTTEMSRTTREHQDQMRYSALTNDGGKESRRWFIDLKPLERDHAQFLPVTLEGLGVDEVHREYWLVNWLKRLDCLDESRSMNEYESGMVYSGWTVVDPRLFPPNVLVGRLNSKGDHYSQTVIRGDLLAKLIQGKLPGPQIHGVWHSGDRGAPEPLCKPGGGQVERKPPDGPWPGYFN